MNRKIEKILCLQFFLILILISPMIVLAADQEPQRSPHINSITPTKAPAGNITLIIKGNNFGHSSDKLDQDVTDRIYWKSNNSFVSNGTIQPGSNNTTIFVTEYLITPGVYNVTVKAPVQAQNGSVTIVESNGKNLTVLEESPKMTPIITWRKPADITNGTALSSIQLNATASVSGTFSYTPPAGTILNPGNNTLHVDFTPTDEVNYTTASMDLTVNVLEQKVTPEANFSSNVTSGYAPLSVQFTDLSRNATAWNWEFGDGTNSAEQSPKQIYLKEGNYTVNLTAINGNGTNSKRATITVLKHPIYAYITNSMSDSVSVIDTENNTLKATVPVGSRPQGVGVSTDGSRAYISNYDSNNVSVIDTATDTVIASVNVGMEPFGVAINPDGTKVYVANNISDTVSVIDTATNTVTATINVGTTPWGLAVSPDGTKVFVDDLEDVSVIDTATNTVTATVDAAFPAGVAVSPDGTKVYVTKYGGLVNGIWNSGTSVYVIDTAANTVTATVNVGSMPSGLAVSPDGSKVYVANADSNNVSVIDTATNSVTATVNVGSEPWGVSFSPDGSKVYVANRASDTVSVIDTATNNVTDTVIVGYQPIAFGQFIEQPVFPSANFVSNVSEGSAPLSVQFTDLSKNALVWKWDFGDGATSTDKNPAHTYSTTGTFNINLTVINSKGDSSKTGIIIVKEESSSSGSSAGDSSSVDNSGGDSGSSGGSSHSSGGGGGGGAGGSPEPQSNVETKELSQAFVASGSSVKFDFPQKTTSVVNVSFDSKKTAGKTTTIVEMLKEKSTLVSGLPSDEVYKYLNIWVGSGGFATSSNIENAVVCFKVEKTWLQNNSVDKSSIVLNRYSDSKWDQLPTNSSGDDDTFLYFTAKTPGFSEFAITGKTAAKEAVTETSSKPNIRVPEQNSTGNALSNDGKAPEQTQSSNISDKSNTKTPGFEIASAIICLLCVFLYKRK